MNATEREMVSLVMNVDSWAQEHNRYVDKQFSNLYVGDNDNGWESLFKNSPSAFYRAYALALEYKEKAEEAGYLDY
jgi:hypothetical protein